MSYVFPREIIQKISIGSLRVYVTGENFLLIKSKEFTGPDPETPGSLYPQPVSFTLGINVTL